MRGKLYWVIAALMAATATQDFAHNDSALKVIYFDIEGRNVGSVKITNAVIQFEKFNFQWGSMRPHSGATYTDDIAKAPPKVVTLSWENEITGLKSDVEVSIPELPKRFNGEGYRLIHGRYQGEGLILRFDIDPGTDVVCAIWTDVAFPSNDVRCQ